LLQLHCALFREMLLPIQILTVLHQALLLLHNQLLLALL